MWTYKHSSSFHADNCKNNFVVVGEGPTDDINGSVSAARQKFSINFTKTKAKFYLTLISTYPRTTTHSSSIFYFITSVTRSNFMKFFVEIMNISYAILIVFESRGFRKKNYIGFSNNTFTIDTVIINLGNYIWGIWFIHKNT